MKFKKAIEETPDLKNSWCAGLQALSGADREHVAAEDTHRLTGSVNVDAALQEKFPNDNRWDYAVGHQPSNLKGEMVYWIEIHPASSGEVKALLAKLEWLQGWLRSSAPKLHGMRRAFIGFPAARPHLRYRPLNRSDLHRSVCVTWGGYSRFLTRRFRKGSVP